MKYYTVEKLEKISKYSGISLSQIQDVIKALNEFERRELEQLRDYIKEQEITIDVVTFSDFICAKSKKKLLKIAKRRFKNETKH